MRLVTLRTPRRCLALITAWMFATPEMLHATTFTGSITFTSEVTAPTYGAWTRYVSGLDVSVEIKGIGIGSTLWPDGGLACRTCTQQVMDVTCVRCFNSRWDRFWWKVENSTLLSWNNGAPRNDTSTQTKLCCGTPAPNRIDDLSGVCLAEVTSASPPTLPSPYTVASLYIELHSALRFNAAAFPFPEDNTVGAYIDDVALRYFAGAAKWNQGANEAASMSGEEPRAGQMASILFALGSEMNRIGNNLAGPGVVPGDFFQMRQLTSQLESLYLTDPSSVPTELALRTETQVAILSEIDSITTAGVDSFEVLAFIDALERYNSWSFFNVAAGVQYQEQQVDVSPSEPEGASPDPSPLVTVYPNPSHETFLFRVRADRPDLISLDILDTSGRRVESLRPEYEAAGSWLLSWKVPESVPGGVYFYRLANGAAIERGKLTLIR